MVREGVLKSLILGLLAGAGVLFLTAFVFWMAKPDLLWVAVLAFGVVTGGVTVILYYKKYKPTIKAIARRVDDLGLQERLLTMVELEGDDSYIAQRQREDALSAMEKVGPDLLKIIVSTAAVVAVSIVGTLSVGMATVTGLSSAGILPSGGELWNQWFGEPPVYYEVTYVIDGQGQLILENGEVIESGATYQTRVKKGADAEEVYASGGNEWVFIEWSDGHQTPSYSVKNVTKDITISAVFAQISGSEGDDNVFDEPDDLPPTDGEGIPKPNPNPPKNPNDQHGGQYVPSNQIIDNKTYFGHEYDAAYEKALEELDQDEEISEDQKDMTGAYFDTIKSSKDAEEDQEGEE